MSLEAIILILTTSANLFLGAFILARNPKLRSSRSFFALSVSISTWAVSNYLTELTSISLQANALFNRLAYLFAFWCLVAITVFCYSFPRHVSVSRRKAAAFRILAIVGSIVSLTDLVAGKVTKDNAGLHFLPGALSIVYALVLVVLLGLSARQLLKSKRANNKQVASQINLVLFGFCFSVIMALFTNVLLPSISDNFDTAKFGPLLTVILVGTTTYAIVRHKLFDIRLVIVRGFAYALSLGSILVVYAIISLEVSNNLLSSTSSNALRSLLNILLIVIAMILYSPIRRYFNKITNKFFYRDAYEPQEFLSDINKVVLSSIDVDKLLRESSDVISTHLKSEYIMFSLSETAYGPSRTIGSTTSHMTNKDLESLDDAFGQTHSRVVVSDTIEADQSGLKTFLQKFNVGILVKLTTSLDGNADSMGYLLLGHKKSGNPYNQQDEDMVQIITGELVIAIENALRFEEIRNFNLTLQQKVDDATHKLQRANEKLKAMDETKDEFISMASHQLRTPLTSVKGYLSMVIEGDAGELNEMQKKLLGQSFTSSQRMVYLIADLLNLSRLRTGKFIIDSIPTNLAKVITGELEQLKEALAAKELELDYEEPKDFPMLMFDETKIRQVLMNFIDNAIYYTPNGGHITVSLKNLKDSIEFTVKDNGIGVPQHEQRHLFNKFYRAGNARKARPDGTGLGLFMAKKVVVASGGAIMFNSIEDKGSTFGFTFSKHRLAVPEITPAPASDK